MALKQRFERIDKTVHDLKGFDCGKPEMNRFLTQYAVKHGKLGLSSTFVLTEDTASASKRPVAVYYTFCSATVTRQSLPTTQSLPAYPVPVVLLARLAVDTHYQRQRLGEKSLVYALRHAVQLCDSGLPAHGLILDVLDRDALHFYQQFDMFECFADNPMPLFVSMNTLRDV